VSTLDQTPKSDQQPLTDKSNI